MQNVYNIDIEDFRRLRVVMRKKVFMCFKCIMAIAIIFIVVFVGYSVKVFKDDISLQLINEKIEVVKQDNKYVEFHNIDKVFLKSIVAVEDHRFYEHGAVDLIAIARATYENVRSGDIVQGGSTITQQLAKNLFLSNEQTFKRKIKETIISFIIEKEYSKNEILELYVNVIYYGDGYEGILEASRGYFHKEPSKLNKEEATLLAGIPQAPSYYQLSNNYKETYERQKEVLDALNNFKYDIALEMK